MKEDNTVQAGARRMLEIRRLISWVRLSEDNRSLRSETAKL